MKLSIIICVYNTAQEYLRACIESVRRSTLTALGGDYEICLIDDGSEIDYSELIADYPLKYVRCENGGIFAARRRGIAVAEGEYVAFCDSDDEVSFNYHYPMLEEAERRGADIVINDWAFLTNHTRYYCANDSLIAGDYDLAGDDALLAFTAQRGREHSYFVLWNKLFKTELLRRAFDEAVAAGIKENCSFSEDTAINFFAWKHAKRVVNIHTGYYFYRIHDSQTVNVISAEKLRTHISFMSDCFSAMEHNVGGNAHAEAILDNLRAWRELMSRTHYSHACKKGYTELYPFIKERYSVSELKKSTYNDESAYYKNVLLGDNFSDVEERLRSIWASGVVTSVEYNEKDLYTARSVAYLKAQWRIAPPEEATAHVSIPELKSKLANKLIHNPFIYKASTVVFKKGSRTRAFLKKLF